MNRGEASAVRVDGEYRAILLTQTAATVSGAIESITRQNQTGRWINSLAEAETMQVRKTRAIDVKGEHRAAVVGAPLPCRPIQFVT